MYNDSVGQWYMSVLYKEKTPHQSSGFVFLINKNVI